jgi:3D (Asp-Asp-Asp) domain-containing protein
LSQSHTITISSPIESAQASETPEYSPLCGLSVVECDNEPKKELETFRKVKGTTYNAEVGQTDSSPFIMANGKRVNESAVASNCYPLGTKISVKGFGVYTVEDRMNRRYTADCGTDRERIDFFKFSRRDNFAKIVEISVQK